MKIVNGTPAPVTLEETVSASVQLWLRMLRLAPRLEFVWPGGHLKSALSSVNTIMTLGNASGTTALATLHVTRLA